MAAIRTIGKKHLIQYVSDVHVDKQIYMPDIRPVCGTLILAGDVGSPYAQKFRLFMHQMSTRFDKVFFVAGNHEYHCNSGLFNEKMYAQSRPLLRQVVSPFCNVHLLEDAVYKLDDRVVIAGTTLWSNPPPIPDLTKVDKYRAHMEKHQNSVRFIESVCKQYAEKRVVMVSHYVPTFRLIEHRYFKYGIHNGSWYATNLEHLMRDPIKVWICGHSHSKMEVKVNKVFCGLNAGGATSACFRI